MSEPSQSRVNFNEEFLNLLRDKEDPDTIKRSFKEINAWNLQDQLGNTLLHYAAKYSNHEMVQYLIESGSNVNIQNDLGRTPIVEAIENGSDKATQILLHAGADIYKPDRSNETALHRFFQAENHIKDTLGEIFLNKVQSDCSCNNELITNVLYNAGCELPYVVLLKNITITKTMLERGCQVDARNGKNQTALHTAVMSVDAELVILLLQYNANPNLMDNIDLSPLGYLYDVYQEHSDEHFRILKMLIIRDAAFTLKKDTNDKLSQIISVLKFGNSDAIQHLLFANLDLNERIDISENTPIHILAQNQTPNVFQALDVSNFDVEVRNLFFETPLLIAAQCGNAHVIEYLIKKGAKVNAFDPNGISPLFNAVNGCTECKVNPLTFFKNDLNYLESIELLLKHGADAQQNPAGTPEGLSKVLQLIRDKSSRDMHDFFNEYFAVAEAFGTKITSYTRAFIDESRFRYDHCKQYLSMRISGSVTMFDLLSANELKFENYSRNEAVQRFCTTGTLKSYVDRILKKKISKALRMIELKKDAAMVLCSIMEMEFVRFHIIAEKILDYLNEQDLENLLMCNETASDLSW